MAIISNVVQVDFIDPQSIEQGATDIIGAGN